MSGLCCTIGRYSLTVVVLVLVLSSRPAEAEWFVAAQGGAAFDGHFDRTRGTGASGNPSGNPGGLIFSDLGLQPSGLYGAKAGYFIDEPGWKWLGIEMEAYTSTQNLNQQAVTINDGGTTTVELSPGQNVRVTNWAPIIFVLRYQLGRLEPYAGGGLGVYFIHIHDAATDTSSNDNWNMGFIAKAGLRWMVTDHLALFGEWKYNLTRFSYDPMRIGSTFGSGFSTYDSHIAVAGIGWHF